MSKEALVLHGAHRELQQRQEENSMLPIARKEELTINHGHTASPFPRYYFWYKKKKCSALYMPLIKKKMLSFHNREP